MSQLPEPVDPRTLRVSDADREVVVDVLRQAAGDGRITFEELDERLGLVYSAKTYADLEGITVDLPVPGVVPPSAAPHGGLPANRVGGIPSTRQSVAILSEVRQTGPWVVPPSYVAFTVLGSIRLDLRQARFSEPVTTIQAYTILGGIEIIVPEDIEVDVGGIGVMAGFNHTANGPGVPGAPRLKVTGFALLGAVEVRRMPLNRPGIADRPAPGDRQLPRPGD